MSVRAHEVERGAVRRLLQDERYLRQGLRQAEVETRRRRGEINTQRKSYSQSIWRIVRRNLFTIFNLLTLSLAGLIVLASLLDPELIKNLSFLGVVLANLLLGILQEIRAKRTVDKLSLLNEPRIRVIRDGRRQEIPVEEVVVDDLVYYRDGNQITVDGELLRGEGFELDESLLTGESDPVAKQPGDLVSSGSYVVAGEGYCHVSLVGEDTYASKISSEVSKRKREQSVLTRSLNLLITWISFAIIPIAILLFLSKFLIQPGDLPIIIVSTVSAVIGMVPLGLILLTSVAFATATIRLGQKRALVQNLTAIETLARIDVLCLDKTGTITSGDLVFDRLHPFTRPGGRAAWEVEAEARAVLAHMLAAQPAGNATQLALTRAIEPQQSPAWQVVERIHFRSERKWSAARFADQGSYYLGAAERLIRPDSPYYQEVQDKLVPLTEAGKRVVLLGHTEVKPLDSARSLDSLLPLALLSFSDEIRPDAEETFAYFQEQGVDIRLISGDSPRTVAAIARRIGLEGAEAGIDLSDYGADADYAALARDHRVFGRVDPEQKRALLKGLQDQGLVVAMTGDGINDVPALKDADCGVALASGSEAARSAADIVLLEDNLSQMVDAVHEGRRVVNNIERVAAVYLNKTVYSMILAFAFIFIQLPYPILPLQMSLIATCSIGMPTFFLALRPNRQRMEDGFLERVLMRAVPIGILAALLIIGGSLLAFFLELDYMDLSSIAFVILACTSLYILALACRPLHPARLFLWIASASLLTATVLLFPDFFDLHRVPRLLQLATIYLPLLGVGAVLLYLSSKDQASGRIARLFDRLITRSLR